MPKKKKYSVLQMCTVSSAKQSMINIIKNFINRLDVRTNCIFGVVAENQKILFV